MVVVEALTETQYSEPEMILPLDSGSRHASRLDAGVAALRHAKAQLQRYRQTVLAAAVTGQYALRAAMGTLIETPEDLP